MTAERWAKVRALIERAMALPPAERADFLHREAEPDLAEEANRLLTYDGEATAMFPIEGWQQRTGRPSSTADGTLSGTVAGSYRLLHELGQGGMGAVYLAERSDGVYQQHVAIKVLRDSIFTPLLADRFKQERQILARLRHPGIARLLDGGVMPDGRPYLVLEYVDGLPIDRYCAENHLDTKARLRLFLRVAEVVQSAHQQLVLHLDLKPANILVTAEGEPRLLDFGIARILSETGAGTDKVETTLRLLTPRYASPEQAEGAPLGVSSDVFSLGTLLYQLLTRRLPYPIEEATPLEAARLIREVPPVLPSRSADAEIAPELRGDLDTILLQALRKESDRRYPTVAAFAEDVQRHLNSEPVQAHADSFGYRAGKFLRRNRAAVIAASMAAVILLISAAAVIHSDIVARRERATAERERGVAERRLKDMRSLAHSYVFDLDPKLEQIPGTVEIRHFVLKNAQKYLEAMSQEDSGDDDLARELSQGYSRIGQVQEMPGMPSLDDFEGAEASMSKGVAIQKRLLSKNPNNLQDRGLLMMQMRHWSGSPDSVGDMEREEKILREAWEVGQPIIAAGPSLRRFPDMGGIADALGLLQCGNDNLWNFADPLAAAQWFDLEQKNTDTYRAAHPEQPSNQSVIGSYERIAIGRATILVRTNRAAEARPYYEEALRQTTLTHGEIIEDESRKLIREYYADYLLSMGEVHAADAMMPRPTIERDIKRERRLSSDDADALTLIARIDLESGRIAPGKSEMEKGLSVLETLHKALPLDSNTSSELAWDTYFLAQEKVLDTATRKRLYLRAKEVAQIYNAAHPTVLSAAMLMGKCELGLAALAKAASNSQEQQTHATASMAQFSRVLAAHPIQPEASSLLAQAKTLATI